MNSHDTTRRRAGIHPTTLGLILMALLSACGKGDKGDNGDNGDNGDAGMHGAAAALQGGNGRRPAAAVTVEATTPTQGEIRVEATYPGELRAEATAQVSAEVAGRTRAVNVRLGDRVTKGQALATIDPTVYEQRSAESQAAFDVAVAAREEARVTLANVQAELQHKRPLQAQGLITEREIEDLEARVQVAQQQQRLAAANVDQATAKLATARGAVGDTQVRAPFTGRIARRHVDPGTRVAVGQPLFDLVDDAGITLRLNIPESDASLVRIGMPVLVSIEAAGSQPAAGRVGRIAPSIDAATRTLQIDVLPAAAASASTNASASASTNASASASASGVWPDARPGMFARGKIELAEELHAITVPNPAVRRRPDRSPYVWVVEDGKAQQRDVTVGLHNRERTQITQGLSATQTIIIRGQEKLRDGAAVLIIDGHGHEPTPAAARAAASQATSTP